MPILLLTPVAAAARTAVLRAYQGAIATGQMTAQRPIIWPTRRTKDGLDYWIDCSALLEPAGDYVSTVLVSVTPRGDPNDLVVGEVLGMNAFAGIFLSGGVDGRTYQISTEVTTFRGRRLNIPSQVAVSGAGLGANDAGVLAWQIPPGLDFRQGANAVNCPLFA